MLRKHQASIDAIIRRVCDGREACSDILAHVTPGGGKSALPIIAGRMIRHGLADRIAWVVPRLTLQYQAESNFVDPFFRKLLQHDLTIRSSTNDSNPCRGLDGFATTYYALGLNNAFAVEDFHRRRYILACDEFHHMEDGGVWYKAIEPLYERSVFRLMMTGTLTRGDKKQIGFLKYKTVAEDPQCEIMAVDDDCAATFRQVNYTRGDALAERAIIPVRFYLHDGSTRWKTRDGRQYEFETFGMSKSLSPAAVYTAINTEFAEELLDRGVHHWLEYKKQHRSSQMLVVAANIRLANKALDYLHRKNIPASLATSADNEQARESIRQLNMGHVSCLVGVAMFYEGFDRKQVSHVISLTHIRSTPWIEQMVARAVRVDPAIPYDEQYAFVFAPNDPNFRRIVEMIEAEQIEFVRKRKKRDGEQLNLFEEDDGDGDEEKGYPIIPLGSSLKGLYEREVGYRNGSASVETTQPIFSPPTPSERERMLRKNIEQHVRIYSANAGYKPFKVNREIKEAFSGKSRDEMNLRELERVKEYLLIHYPLDRRRRPPVRRSATML